jgi:periplasmic protein TonB
MARKYFDQLVISGAKQKGAKRKLSVPVSMGIHAFVIGGIILVPLLITPDLPAPAKGAINAFFVEAAAPPPPPPPPPAAAAPKQVAQVKPKIEQPKIVPQEEPKFVAPIETPPEVPEEAAADPGLGEGVPEGVVGGVPEGVVGGVPEGVPGGVVGGVEGGVPGGEVGGTGGGDAPAPEATPEPPSGPVRVGGQIKAPSKLKDVAPKYSDMARQARVQGVVVLECVISPDGRVTNVKVLRGIPLLDGSAVEAVKQWVYSPTLLNGQPVAVVMTVTVNFKLS